ncbi:MAG: prolyl oligopeptidase family serine peptidase [Saprospiraceae bacterium]|nr:prolyl oligopeptidase family serine peptidase [Saprospiraceae bacterium]
MKTFPFALFILVLLLGACDNNDNEPLIYASGQNRYTLTVETTEREYYVHVPQGYTGNTATPVVLMLHGTSGNGLDMYDRSGWKEVGEMENILTVYPSSLRYCIIDSVDGQKNTTKWNVQPAEWVFCANETPRDDIKFLNAVLDNLDDRFNVDYKRVYLVGFSNGGQMSAKCSIELSDRLAAVVSNAAAFNLDTTYTPQRILPTAFQLGNKDYGPGVDGPEIPLSQIDVALTDLTYKPARVASTHIKSFGLSPNYVITGDTNTAVIATYPSLTAGSPNNYRFVFVKGLGHAYPNGENHWMKAAELHWEWLKQFSIP